LSVESALVEEKDGNLDAGDRGDVEELNHVCNLGKSCSASRINLGCHLSGGQQPFVVDLKRAEARSSKIYILCPRVAVASQSIWSSWPTMHAIAVSTI